MELYTQRRQSVNCWSRDGYIASEVSDHNRTWVYNRLGALQSQKVSCGHDTSRDSKTIFFLPRIIVVMPGYCSVKHPEASQGGESSLSFSTHACFDGGSQRSGGPESLSTWDWWTRCPSGISRALSAPSIPSNTFSHSGVLSFVTSSGWSSVSFDTVDFIQSRCFIHWSWHAGDWAICCLIPASVTMGFKQ